MLMDAIAIILEKYRKLTAIIRSVFINKLFINKLMINELINSNYAQKASLLTYATLLSIFPLLLLTYSILSAIPLFHGALQQIYDIILSHVTSSTSSPIKQYLPDFTRQIHLLTPLSILFLFTIALPTLNTIDKTINHVFHTSPRRRGIRRFLFYLAILTTGPIIVGLVFLLTSFLTTVKLLSNTVIIPASHHIIALDLLSFSLSTSLLTLLYFMVPNCKVRFRHALTGAFIVACLNYIVRTCLAFFLNISANYQIIYGAFAFIPLLLLWIYVNWLLVLIGAGIVHGLRCKIYRTQASLQPPLMIMFISLYLLDQQFQQGSSLRYRQITEANWRIGINQWEECVYWLTEKKVIFTQPDGSIITRLPLSKINTLDLISQCPWPIPETENIRNILQNNHPRWFVELLNKLITINEPGNKLMNCSIYDFLHTKNLTENTAPGEFLQ